ncbi:LAMI_0G00980g1_1 [Lachancea mirantina]|uniref:LAMI_0G00980g1_1 n=1 Tax=Lachancea mirantina TaxID=1230905 RepID=A0A1G4K7E8_9SACH|nr:LAMI_0G00980g1_1 [Lachancea mirantina]
MSTLLSLTPVSKPLACTAFRAVPCRSSSWFSKILYPFTQKDRSIKDSYGASSQNGNQCFLPVRSGDELNELLMFNNRAPLILNFTVRGNDVCNKLTGALNRIVLLETDKKINIADVETDYLETRDSMLRFGVHQIPTLVAVRKTFPVDHYSVPSLKNKEIDWGHLKAWIEKNADSKW